MVKISKYFSAIIAVVLLLVSLTNCEVGLGESVDTQPPTLTISYPPAKRVIRGVFTMTGSANDETMLKEVSIDFISLDTGETVYTRSQTITDTSSTWTFSVNEKSGSEWAIKDGSYTVKVTVTDNADRTTSAERVYTIDNTAPILIVSTPSSTGAETSSAYGFGDELNFEGLQFDENQGSTFKFKFYDASGNLINEVNADNQLSNWSIDITDSSVIASLAPSGYTEPPVSWYTITVSDSSQSYVTPSDGDKEDNGTGGNWSEYYYSWTQITNTVEPGESTPKIDELYNLNYGKTGTYSSSFPKALTQAKLNEIAITNSFDTAKLGLFSVDPNGINPKVTIEGWTCPGNSTLNSVEQGGTKRIEISKGKNLTTSIITSSLKAKLEKDSNGWVNLYTTATDSDGWRAITNITGTSPVVTNWDLTEANASGDYRLTIEALNNENNKAENNQYLFSVNLGSPTITILPGTGSTATIHPTQNGANDSFKVNVTGKDDGKALTLKICDASDKTNPIYENKNTVYATESDGRNAFEWTYEIDSTGLEEKELYFVVTDTGGRETTQSRKYIFSRDWQEIKKLTSPWTWITGETYPTSIAWSANSTLIQINGSSGYPGGAEKNTSADLANVLFYLDDLSDGEASAQDIGNLPFTSWTVGTATGSDTLSKPGQIWSTFKGDLTATNEHEYVIWVRLTDTTAYQSANKEMMSTYGTPIKIGKASIDTVSPSGTIAVTTGQIEVEGQTSLAKGGFTLSGNSSDTFRASVKLEKTPIATNITEDITTQLGSPIGNTWSLTETNLSDGTYTYKLTVADKAGHVTEALKEVRVDTTAPSLQVNGFDSIDVVYQIASGGSISGLVSDNSALKKLDTNDDGYVYYDLADGSGWKPVASSDKGAWTYSVGDLTENGQAKKIRFKAQDKLGNETIVPAETGSPAVANYYKFGYDSAYPVLTLGTITDARGAQTYSSGTSSYTVTGDYTIAGSASDGNGVVWVGYNNDTSTTYTKIRNGTIESPAIAAGVSGNWSQNITVASDGTKDGTIPLWITAEDTYGKQTTVKVTMLYDTQAPIISGITIPATITELETGNAYQIKGSWFDNGGSGITGGSAKIEYKLNSGSWTEFSGFPLTLPNLSNGLNQTIAFRATDKAGNITSDAKITSDNTYTFNIDTAAPVINITTSDVTYLKKDASYTFAGTASDNLSLAKVVISVQKNGADVSGLCKTITSSPESWTTEAVTSSTSTEGVWTFKATAYDASGRTTSTELKTIKVDATAPSATLTKKPDALANTAQSYEFGGEATDGTSAWSSGLASIKLSLSSDGASSQTVTSGTWAATLDLGDSEGVRTLYYKTTDLAGNETAWTAFTNTFVYDKAAPVLTETTGKTSANDKFSLTGSVTDGYGRANDNGGSSSDGLYVTQKRNDGTEQVISGSGLSWSGSATNGTWTLSDLPRDESNPSDYLMADGTFVFKIKARDKAGKTSEEIIRTVIIDTNAPDTNTITVPSADVTGSASLSGTTYSFKGSARDASGGQGVTGIYYVFSQSATAPQQGSQSTTGYTAYTGAVSDGSTWTIAKNFISGTTDNGTDLCEGIWYLHIKAKDAAGNITANAATRKVEIDLAAPSITADGNTSMSNKTALSTITNITGSDTYGLSSIVITQKKDGGSEVTVYNNTTPPVSGTAYSSTNLPKKTSDGTTDAATDGSDDGIYEYTITVTDKVGKTAKINRTIRFDTAAPVVTVTSPAANEWKSSTTVGVTGIASDLTGINAVYVKAGESVTVAGSNATDRLLDATWTSAGWTKATGTVNWSATISGYTEGESRKVNVCAVDTLGNVQSAAETIAFNIDTATPTAAITTVGSASNSKDGTDLNSNVMRGGAFAITGTASDTNYQSAVLSYSKDGGESQDIASGTGTNQFNRANDGTWTYTQSVDTTNHTNDGLYAYTLTVTDKAGKTATSVKRVRIDTAEPVLTITNITPVVVRDSTNYVNGKVTISGVSSDNYAMDGVPKYTYTTINNEAVSGTSESWTIEIDTRNVEDAKNLSQVLTFGATDKTGNTLSQASTDGVSSLLSQYIVSQSTDKPIVTLDTPADTTVVTESGITATKNLYKTTEKLSGTITDDDGISSVVVTIDEGVTGSESITTYQPNSAKTYTLSHPLTGLSQASHTVKIVVTDSSGLTPAVTTTVGAFTIGIDNDAPALVVTTESGKYYNAAFNMQGTMSDTYALNATAPVKCGEDAVTSHTLAGDNKSGTWTQAVAKPATSESGSKTITAFDKFGRKTSAVVTYIFDLDSPTISRIAIDDNGNGNTLTESSKDIAYFNKNSRLVITGESGDSTSNSSCQSGLKTLMYAIASGHDATEPAADDASWTTIAASSNWTINTDLSGKTDGAYTVFIKALDSVGNRAAETKRYIYALGTEPALAETGINAETSFKTGAFTLSGTVTGTDMLSLKYKMKTDNGAYGTESAVSGWSNGNTTWTINAADAGDGHTVTYMITATNKAKMTKTVTRAVTIDKTAPSPVISVPTSGQYLTSSSQTFSGTASDTGSGVKTIEFACETDGSIVDGDYSTITNSGNWLYNKTGMTEGDYKVGIRVTDYAGNKATAETAFYVDLNVPTVPTIAVGSAGNGKDYPATITSNQNGVYYRGAAFTISGLSTENTGKIYDKYMETVTLTVAKDGGSPQTLTIVKPEGGAWTAGSTWSYTANGTDGTNADGTYVYTITAVDKAGQTTTKSATVCIDTAAPTIGITNPSDGESTTVSTYTYRGTITEEGSGIASVKYYIDDVEQTSPAISRTGSSWSIANVPLSTEGIKAFKLVAKDNLNHETTSDIVNLNYDLYSPDLEETGIGSGGKTTNANFSFTGFIHDTNDLNATAALAISATGYSTEIAKTAMTLVTSSNYTSLGATEAMATAGKWYKWTKELVCGTNTNEIPDGTHVFTLTGKDTAGKTKVLQRTVTVDRTKPTISAIAGDSRTLVNTDENSAYIISGTATDGTGGTGINTVYYAIKESTESAPADGSADWVSVVGTSTWNTTLDLSGNTYKDKTLKIFVTAKDNAGNYCATASSKTITTDSKAPDLAVSTATGKIVGADFVISGTVSGNDAASGGLSVVMKKAEGDTGATLAALSGSDIPTNDDWACTVAVATLPSGVTNSDGTFTITATAKDKNNRTTEKTYTFVRDTTKPAYTLTNIASDNSTVLLDASPQINGSVTDAIGLSTVVYHYEKYTTTWTDVAFADSSATKSLSVSGLTSYTFNLNMKTDLGDNMVDGLWRLVMVASDKRNDTNGANKNTTQESAQFIADSTKPALTNVKIGSSSDSTVYANATITITGNATDVGGMANVTISVNGNALTPITTFASDGAWTSTSIAAGSNNTDLQANTTNEITIVAKDKAGWTTQTTRNVFYDNELPVLTITSISPTVEDTVNAGKYYLNGTVTIKGTTADNDKVNSATYSWDATDSGNDKTNQSVGSNLNNWTIELDTATVANSTALNTVLTFIAKDRAGNTATTASGLTLSNYTIDQTSDKPQVKPANITTNEISSESDVGYISGTPVNVFNRNNKLTFNLEDDDGLKTIKIKFDSGDYIIISDGTSGTLTDGNPTSVIANYTLPTSFAYGRHEVYIRAEDKNWTSDTATPNSYILTSAMYIAVDDGEPVITITTAQGDDVYSTSPISIAGTVTDGNGIASVKYGSTNATVNGSDWSTSYTTSDTTGTLTFTATDNIGNTSQKTFSFKIDSTAPTLVFGTGFTSSDTKVIDSTSPSLRITGTATDPDTVGGNTVPQSKLKQIKYLVLASSASTPTEADFTSNGIAAIGTDSWSANMDLSAYKESEGTYKVWVAAFDNAGNCTIGQGVVIKMDTASPTLSINSTTSPVAVSGTNSVKLYKENFTLSGSAGDTVQLSSLTAVIRNGASLTVTPSATLPATSVTWTITVPIADTTKFASDGAYEIVLTATDGCGKTKQETYAFTRDTAAPTASLSNIDSTGTIATPVTKFTNSGPLILGTYSDATSGISTIKYTFQKYNTGTSSWDTGTERTFTVSSGTTSGALSLPMETDLGLLASASTDGIWTVKVVATDIVGNVGTIAIETNVFRVDRHTPAVTVTEPNISALKQKGDGITVSGTATDSLGGEVESVYISIVHDSTNTLKKYTTIYPTSFTGANSDTWTWTLAKTDSPFDADNDYTITVKVTDKGGNTKEAERVVSCDNTPPEMVFKRPFTMTTKSDGTGNGTTSQSGTLIGTITVEGTIPSTNSDSIKETMGQIYYQIGTLRASDGTGDDIPPTITKDGNGKITAISIPQTGDGAGGLTSTDGAVNSNLPTGLSGYWKKSSDNYGWSFTVNTLTYAEKYAVKTTAGGADNLKTLVIYVVAADAAGNLNYAKFPINIDTDGDKPIPTITAPEEDIALQYAKVGGSFVITGGASDNDYVHSVYMQVEVKNGNYIPVTDESGVANGMKVLAKNGSGLSTIKESEIAAAITAGNIWAGMAVDSGQTASQVLAGSGTTSYYFDRISARSSDTKKATESTDNLAWYKANGKSTWSHTLNKNKEFFTSNIKDFRTKVNEDPVQITVYVKVLDTKASDGTISNATEPGFARYGTTTDVTIQVDSSVPGVELTTFPQPNSYVTAKQTIEFSASDDTTLQSVTLSANGTAIFELTATSATGDFGSWTNTMEGTSGNYTLSKTGTAGSGETWTITGSVDAAGKKNASNIVVLEVKAIDNESKETTMSRSFLVDTTAPTASVPDGVVVGKSFLLASSPTATQRESSDRQQYLRLYSTTAEVSGKVADETNGSDVKFVVLYLTQGDGTSTRIFNTAKGTSALLDSYTHKITPGKKTINGTVSDITDITSIPFWVNDNTSLADITVKSDPATNYIVIDTQEGGADTGDAGDNDGYKENIKIDGTWYVQLDTTKIDDGIYKLNYLVVDNSGNGRYYYDYALVQNNSPTVNSVVLATDANGDGTINTATTGSDAEGTEYSILATTAGGSKDTTNTTDFATRNYKLAIIAEVGGESGGVPNTPLTVTLDYTNSSGTTSKTLSTGIVANYDTDGNPVSGSGITNVTYDSTNKVFKCKFELTAKTDFTTDSSSNTDYKNYKISVTDGISGTPLSSGTKTVKMILNNVDTVPPVAYLYELNTTTETSATTAVTISKSDANVITTNNTTLGSLYSESSTVQGHIELRSDSVHNNDTVKDPDLSGKIILRGKAYDDQRITKVVLTLGTESKTILETDSANSNRLKIATDGSGLVEFNDILDLTGHYVEWSYVWDTATVGANIVGNDIAVKVTVSDARPADDSGPNTNTETAYVNDMSDPYNSMTADVVPYVTKVTTSLSSLKKKNPSVYNRTALGHYPVSTTEDITLTGFNLSGAIVKDSSSNTVTTSYNSGVVTIPAASLAILNSGNLDMSVSGIGIMNNINSNTVTTNKTPNGDNNDLLTDDIYLDIWEFNSSAAPSISGKIEQPIMKINPATERISFAFVNGPLYFSMGGNDTSYNYFCGSYDFFTSIGYTIDSKGNTYGVAAGGDINSTSADKFIFMSGRWGTGQKSNRGSYDGQKALRLESIGQFDSGGTRTFNKQRIKSPSLATSVQSGTGTTAVTNIYMAYYDDMNSEIRFKYGQLSSATKTNFGNFTDAKTGGDCDTYDDISTVQVLATNAAGSTRLAGSYVSIGVASDSGDKVVCVWYDETTRALWYTYNTTPTTDRKNTRDFAGWSTPVRVFAEDSDMETAGEYCQIAVDSSNGIHIAAYDPTNLDLVYAYASTYAVTTTSTFKSCIVDSEGVVGSNITIDVAKNIDSTKATPHIGYFSTSCSKPKYAYLLEASTFGDAGATDDMFTQKWECGVIPTPSTINQQSNQYNKINVGLFQASGTLKAPTTKNTANTSHASGSGYSSDNYGSVYGNGTTNAVLGYTVKVNSSTDAIETAQMR